MMKTMLMAAAAAAIVISAAPASAQIRFGVSPYGGGVEFGGGREHGWRDHWRGAYAYDCPVVRERFVTPSGRVLIRTRRDCD